MSRVASPSLWRRRDLLRLAGVAVSLQALERFGLLVSGRVRAGAPAARSLVRDVLRFSTAPQGWPGHFGFVTFRLHPVFIDGQPAYHIRTDTSDPALARRVGLVHAPKLRQAIVAGLAANYYQVLGGVAGQRPVVSTVPGRDDYTPIFHLHRVTFRRSPRLLTSAAAVQEAAAEGRVRIVPTGIALNLPFVRWPEGELPHDRVRAAYLGEGQLLKPPDIDRREVTFKLQQCFPGEWYIVTDTSAAPMAPMMRIAASPRTQGLTAARATAKILVFGNGIPGPGPMGFQPSIVDSLPGNPVWSPLWDHFTFTWVAGHRPRVVRNQLELLRLEEAGALKRWPGTPDTGGQVFVVNCPIPVSAPVRWRPA